MSDIMFNNVTESVKSSLDQLRKGYKGLEYMKRVGMRTTEQELTLNTSRDDIMKHVQALQAQGKVFDLSGIPI